MSRDWHACVHNSHPTSLVSTTDASTRCYHSTLHAPGTIQTHRRQIRASFTYLVDACLRAEVPRTPEESATAGLHASTPSHPPVPTHAPFINHPPSAPSYVAQTGTRGHLLDELGGCAFFAVHLLPSHYLPSPRCLASNCACARACMCVRACMHAPCACARAHAWRDLGPSTFIDGVVNRNHRPHVLLSTRRHERWAGPRRPGAIEAE